MNNSQYEELKNAIVELGKNVDENKKDIIGNMNKLHNHEEQIQKNTGALELLHTLNNVKKRFFIMWFITFIVLVCSACLNIFLLIK